MNLSGIRAVTFDVGNTLIEPRVSVGETYAEIAAAHGVRGLSPIEIETRFRAAFRAHGGAVNTRDEWARIVDTTFAGLVTQPPSETFFPALFEHFAQSSAWRIFDDVLPALDDLSQRGFRLGIISNWDARLRPLLTALGLGKHFEAIVVSCEARCAKPSRGIFESAANLFKLPEGEILHVGDDLQTDVQGARAVGFRSVQIVRDAPIGGDGIGSLRELSLGLG